MSCWPFPTVICTACERPGCDSLRSMDRGDVPTWRFTSLPEAILAGEPIDLFNHGRMRRDFTYVDDAVAGILQAARRPVASNGEHASAG